MKNTIIIMSVLSILDLLIAIFLGLLIHLQGSITVAGTNLLDIHIVQGMGTVIITLIALALILFRKQ